ncbi:MAG: hypothetical protein HKP32_06420 [Woeseia sp.]|nr:hypothetical protein [Woeseia sp.]MBT8098052.1 hypothetical protein [Woeseia sp.]NNL54768.1 hypothetical protein [Woeseia sp.]
MSDSINRRTPLLLLPFVWLWRLLGFFINLAGRIVCALLGLVLMIAGVTLTLTVVGVPAGIPLSVLGFLLLIRALF